MVFSYCGVTMLNKKIVLSDDANLIAVLEESFFMREGFAMTLVEDGAAAVRAVESEAPSLAIFDLEQMGEQAFSSCRTIKQDRLLNATPVLLILPSGAGDSLESDCWDCGCDAVVPRPLSSGRLLDAACRLLGISRRLARRFPVSFQLELLDNQQKKHAGACVNLNTGGMFIATETLYPVDTRLVIDFVLPGYQTELHCPVRVAWVNHPEWLKKNEMQCGLGVEFLNPESGIRAALQDFLDSLPVRK